MTRTSRLSALTLTLLLTVGGAHAGLPEAYAAFTKGDFTLGIREYEAAAQAGNTQAQLELGQIYLKGYYTGRNLERAYTLFRQAAAQNVPEAMYWLGVMQANADTDGVPNPHFDLKAALITLQRGAALNSNDAMGALLAIYAGQEPFYVSRSPALSALRNPQKGLELARSWAQSGSAAGMARVIEVLNGEFGLPANPTESRSWLLKLAGTTPRTADDLGHVLRALFTLAALQQKEGGLKAAYPAYVRAAELGDPDARVIVAQQVYTQMNSLVVTPRLQPDVPPTVAARWLAEIMENPDRPSRDATRAGVLLARLLHLGEYDREAERALLFVLKREDLSAAEQAELRYRLGELYLQDDSELPRDAARAYDLFTQAAAADHPQALGRMAFYYLIGDARLKNPHDYARARQYAQNAASRKDGLGTLMLAVIYHLGYGVTADLTRARAAYQDAIAALKASDWEDRGDFLAIAEKELADVQKRLGK
ncbi:tetratricopeptide repeat protein [Deinococcus sp. JMULE3]|uniref:tetratricopeptide repeat protein n=1 Tax=Deinococcus sp. JMULE3 TaxID=2518341 RepID=UPI001576CC15|nr:SEL1-like repeat protein [Deinococcus sp. JMULE3]NTY01525.1 sel1 repeat family protein [Deinococcus sp. JMULE3]